MVDVGIRVVVVVVLIEIGSVVEIEETQLAPSFATEIYPETQSQPPFGEKLHLLNDPQSVSFMHSLEHEGALINALLKPGIHEQEKLALGSIDPVQRELKPHWFEQLLANQETKNMIRIDWHTNLRLHITPS